jgi:hypothetical protein
MANAERLAVLAKVREQKKAVSASLNDGATDSDRGRLERLETLLDGIEDELILEELSERVDELKAAASSLTRIVGQMKKSAKKIQKIIDGIDDVARALKILADIAAKASTIV